jgi:hypothetical protein
MGMLEKAKQKIGYRPKTHHKSLEHKMLIFCVRFVVGLWLVDIFSNPFLATWDLEAIDIFSKQDSELGKGIFAFILFRNENMSMADKSLSMKSCPRRPKIQRHAFEITAYH